MVNTRSMAAQHNHVNGVDKLEASIFDGVRSDECTVANRVELGNHVRVEKAERRTE